jgi:hypothetical protein
MSQLKRDLKAPNDRMALKASKVNAEGLRFFSAQSKKSFSDNLPSFASP